MADIGFHARLDSIESFARRKVLVTGATGFLGGAVSRDLIVRGFDVIGTGRNRDKGISLVAAGIDFRSIDLADRKSLDEAMRGVDVVVHCGALAAPWGRRKAFWDSNVVGTQNVIGACLSQSVSRLVHISTPSVVSSFEDQFCLDESEPAPSSFVSEYARSKWFAEEEIRAVDANALETVILRPRAIYGPGDINLLPRILDAARKGRLPIIGDGAALCNITHIDDVVQSIRLAMEKSQAVGRTFFITGGEDLNLSDVVNDVLKTFDAPLPTRTMSVSKAMMMGRTLEWLWSVCRLAGEPPVTRYTVGQFAYSQTLDISAARCALGYRPRVAAAEGIRRLIERREMQCLSKSTCL